MRAEVDQQQHFRAGLEMFLSGKDYPAVVADGTSVESLELSAQMVRLQPGIIDIHRHAPQSRLDGGLERGIFSNQATKRPFKAGREDKFAHGSLGGAQAGDDAFRRLRLELAGTKGGGGIFGLGGRFRAPGFDAAFAQQVFQNFLLIRGQMLGVSQNSIQSESGHRFRMVCFRIIYAQKVKASI